MRSERDDLAADYVECTECGHPIEHHDTTRCGTPLDEPCPCPKRWTKRDIGALRAREGLRRSYNVLTFNS